MNIAINGYVMHSLYAYHFLLMKDPNLPENIANNFWWHADQLDKTDFSSQNNFDIVVT